MKDRWTVRYLGPAQKDLAEIVDYVSRDDPAAAAAFVDEIDRSLSRLARFPFSKVTVTVWPEGPEKEKRSNISP